MTKNTEQHLWVVVHLLYPNSSQALDVYYTILSLVVKKTNKKYSHKIFKKLSQLFIKNAAVRSSQPFQVFENNKLDNWSLIYKRSPKLQLLVICGLIVFKFSIEELAEALSLPEQKIKFLINQSFKKTSQLSIVKPIIVANFEYKKKSEEKVSYLYTNENLVEYGLGLLTESDSRRVEQGLALYKQLVPLQSYYKEIIEELNNLAGIATNQYFIQGKEKYHEKNIEEVKTINFDFFKVRKKLIILTATSAVFILIISLRPSWIQKLSFKKSNESSIVMQEIKNPPNIAQNESVAKNEEAPINLHEMPVGKTETKVDSKIDSKIESKVESKVESKANEKVIAKSEVKEPLLVKAVVKSAPKPEVIAKTSSGLYRASISVTDLNSITSKITEKLVALGGKKAGEVELGWKKTPTLAYYHLVIPEENLEAAKAFIKNFGKLNIQFENHPRVLPAGINRIILEVKESE
ncbi:MAG: hypothetical protein WA160_09375 [Pseudobdellovibrio sp.]